MSSFKVMLLSGGYITSTWYAGGTINDPGPPHPAHTLSGQE